MEDLTTTLVVLDDRHAARGVEARLARLAGRDALVLTSDALLGMTLRRAGHRVRLDVDGLNRDLVISRDAAALEAAARCYEGEHSDDSRIGATSYGGMLQYTLIPQFIRAVRNVHAVVDAMSETGATAILLVGHGELAEAAQAVARARGIPISSVPLGIGARPGAVLRRLRAGRRVRWVNTTFRALVLEPAFLALLAMRGLFKARPKAGRGQPSLIVTGDRFTRDVVDLGDAASRGTTIVAGGTQPGRALFASFPGAHPIEEFGTFADALAALATFARSCVRAWQVGTRGGPALKGLATGSLARGDAFLVAGVSIWPLVRRSAALHLLVWPAVLFHLDRLVARALARHPGSRLLVSQDVTAYNRALVAAAHARGIRSLGLQHGILGEPNGHNIAHVGTLATWGRASERWYRAHGGQSAQFVVTGNGRFDGLAGIAPAARTQPRPDVFTVVICTGFVSEYSVCASDFENLLMLDALAEWARARRDVRVIHKLHPGEEPAHYAHVARRLGWADAMEMTRDVPLYDLLARAHVLVASYSTTVLESVALGTPAIVLDAIARRHHIPLDESPDVTIAFSAAELHMALERLRVARRADREPGNDSRRQQFMREYLHEMDGRATERVVRLLEAL